MITARALLQWAVELNGRANTSEVDRRIVVRSAYYALFHVAKDLVSALSRDARELFLARGGVHTSACALLNARAVRRLLSASTGTRADLEDIGEALASLRQMREIADYELSELVVAADAEDAIKYAETGAAAAEHVRSGVKHHAAIAAFLTARFRGGPPDDSARFVVTDGAERG